MIARQDINFYNILSRADLCVPDGVGLLWAARHLGKPLPERVTGSDGVPKIAERAAQAGWKLYFLALLPALPIKRLLFYANSIQHFKSWAFTAETPRLMKKMRLLKVNASGADILFVAYGAPEQDKWIARNLPRLQVKMAMGVGGSFDFIAGVIPRAPLWMRRYGIEWLYRLYLQPWRIRRMLRLPRFVLAVSRRWNMANLKHWIPQLAGQRILVIGDLILDEYLTGNTTRLSREAPIPALEFQLRQLIPGGAANPAANIVALGSTAVQIGIIGSDTNATNLRQSSSEARGIETDTLITDSSRPTTVKTRIMAHMGLRFPQQVARLDTLSRDPISPAIERKVRAAIDEQIPQVKAVLLSDYHTGLLTPSLVKTIHKLASQAKILLTADAQGKLEKYKGFGVVKCNADEARDYLRQSLQSNEDFAGAAKELCQSLQLTQGMVITRGGDGATVCEASGTVTHCPAPAVTDVYDTVGAGDTTIAVLTFAVAASNT